MDCSLPGSSIHGIPQVKILEWITLPFSRGSSQSRTWVSRIAGRFFTIWATWEILNYLKHHLTDVKGQLGSVSEALLFRGGNRVTGTCKSWPGIFSYILFSVSKLSPLIVPLLPRCIDSWCFCKTQMGSTWTLKPTKRTTSIFHVKKIKRK